MIERRRPDLARLVVLDKPEGPTSFDMVREVRRLTRCARVGHGGTLDPFASGVLVLGLGAATRLLTFAATGAKRYRATFHFGQGTDSHDGTGRPTITGVPHFGEADLRGVLEAFVGEIQQRPPRVSAIKVEGERSYRLHREGRSTELKARAVRIDRIQIERFDLPRVDLEVECGGGTYIRALARDVGEAVDCPAHVAALRRDAVGPFTLAEAVTLDELKRQWPQGPGILSPAAIARHWPRLHLEAAEVQHIRHGGQPLAEWASRAGWSALPDPVALLDSADHLVAVARPRAGELRLALVLPEGADVDGDQ